MKNIFRAKIKPTMSNGGRKGCNHAALATLERSATGRWLVSFLEEDPWGKSIVTLEKNVESGW